MKDKLLTNKFMDGGDVSGFYSGAQSADSASGPGPKSRARKAKRARRRSRRKSGGAKWKPGCGR
jgi:hypothetical protein